MRRGRDGITDLQHLGARHGATLYNVLSRRAGWAVQWHEAARQQGDDWRTGLVVYRHYASLDAMIAGERARLDAREEETACP